MIKILGLLFVIGVQFSSPASACIDKGKVYKVCSDQLKIFEKEALEAKKNKQLLLVNFGADWCPWCHSLHKLFQKEVFMGQFKGQLRPLDIGLFNGSDKTPSGYAVLNKIAEKSGLTQAPNIKGIPYLALVNPSTGKAVFIETDKLEQNTKTTKGHNTQKVADELNKGTKSLTTDSI